ncbi:MAG: hypothetical protein ABJA67_05030 [Chthonomonadales bacterium]
MPPIDFVHTNDLLYSAQLINFATRLPDYIAMFNLVDADIATATNDALFFETYIDYSATVCTYSCELVKGKNQIRSGVITGNGPAALKVLDPGECFTSVAPGIDNRFRELAARIKAQPNYTPAIGADLGIEAIVAHQIIELPSLKGVAEPHGLVYLTFQKQGNVGVTIRSQRGNENSFKSLANPRRSPYVDTRSNLFSGVSEVRKYKYRYLNADGIPTGPYSDTLEITTEP